MSKKQKNWLYLKWLRDHAEQQEVKKTAEVLGIEEKRVVVKKLTLPAKVVEVIFDILYWGGKAILWLLIFGLISFALTVLLNESLRNQVFQAFR